MNDAIYWTGQAIGILVTIGAIINLQLKKKQHMYILSIVVNILSALNIMLLDSSLQLFKYLRFHIHIQDCDGALLQVAQQKLAISQSNMHQIGVALEGTLDALIFHLGNGILHGHKGNGHHIV